MEGFWFATSFSSLRMQENMSSIRESKQVEISGESSRILALRAREVVSNELTRLEVWETTGTQVKAGSTAAGIVTERCESMSISISVMSIEPEAVIGTGVWMT